MFDFLFKKFSLGYNRFHIQINYKSGTSVKVWFYSFATDGSYTSWDPVGRVTPVLLNRDEVESIWQLDHVCGLRGDKDKIFVLVAHVNDRWKFFGTVYIEHSNLYLNKADLVVHKLKNKE